MKERKKSKYKLFAAAIIVMVAGAVMCGAAFAAGAANRDAWAKANVKLRAAQGFYAAPQTVAKTFAADEFTSLDFDIASRDLTIEQGTGDVFELTYKIDFENELTYEVKDGALIFKQNKFTGKNVFGYININIDWVLGFFDGWDDAYKAKLTVPAGFEFEKISVKCTSGNIKLDKLTAQDLLYVKATSGNINIDDAVVKSDTGLIDIRLTSGNLNLKNASAAVVKIDLTSGDAHIGKLAAGKLTAGLTSGNLTVFESDIKASAITLTSGNATFKDMPFASAQTAFGIKVTGGNIRIDGNRNGSPYNTAPAGAEYSIEAALTSGNFRFN